MVGTRASSSLLKGLMLTVLLFLFIFPFLFLLINSFKENTEITSNPLAFAKKFSMENYTTAFEKMGYLSSFTNSLIITMLAVLLISLVSAMTAHYFVRNQTKFNQYTFLLMVASMIIPFQAIMIPLVKIYGSLDMLDNVWSLIYMYVGFGCSLAVFIYHGFVKGVPAELEEAAMIDGCTRTQTFFRIVFPVLMPTTATISILNVLWIWNDFLLPSLVLISPENRTLPLSTFSFYGTYSVDYGPLMAGLVLTILPIMVVYLFAQRYIIQGVMQGSIK
ncbi:MULTISPECIES: carbohydrate ABC transporter permease [unclassified Paenibacillus]|uniref:carbohydrate ABC transporter permease n=1 Tax=unclassified Paenibacillus TaxID=185978 RepID=UPI0024073124|nr:MULTISPECIES: carbohydrate ABC transporter permease [unclassified Paenibacillus]MDF9844752.1 raffinose/stachyose/melibiose transport system permease protein [Paenibacillus sp. PastF-2]MDF9851354.1 raffinose/stachyose/melibiose transport system permease protein [Paenibacillus sp. PastM-2]MDF9857936.1 raffinose/stachyose/melibiose transport system permease protein [Paenibacillus sp. PastF-1]MDH6483203.1 raffinose/stachyose/melibiose transport system permease protein [Paenibacillus sp. PastH-2]